MPQAESEPAIPSGQRPQTFDLDRSATGIGALALEYIFFFITVSNQAVIRLLVL
jgi:hypothetical protein